MTIVDREAVAHLGRQSTDAFPFSIGGLVQHRHSGVVEETSLRVAQLRQCSKRMELGGVKDVVRESTADPSDDSLIAEEGVKLSLVLTCE